MAARLGCFMFNPHSLIAARLLDRDPAAAIDGAWVRARLEAAIALRARVCDTAYHRLVHAEADFLPGLIIDRYDDVVVLQANSAGMDRLTPEIVEALIALLHPRAIVARNDSAARRQEGLAEKIALLHGTDPSAEVREAGVRFAVDPLSGQKTGWFFDQRGNRDRVAALAAGARVLDVFCHVGAFGLRCAAAGRQRGDAGRFQRPGAGARGGGGGAQRVERARGRHPRRRVRDDGGAGQGGRTFRHRGVRSAFLRPLAQGRGGGVARLWPHGAAGGAAGGAGRVSVRRLVQPPRAAGGVGRADRLGAAPGAARRRAFWRRPARGRIIRCIRICRRAPI